MSVAAASAPTGQVPAARDAHPGPLAASREREALGAAPPSGQVWAVVLAGGDGTRVSLLSRGSTGELAPKQYCAFGSGEPLVRQALRRAAGLVPRSRIVVVVAEQHQRHWREALSDLPRENIVVQPRNRGTAPGILLPVLEIVLHRDRDARVLVLPADHHVGSEDILQRTLREAARAVRRPGAPVVLLGMAGEEGDHEYGWILSAVRPLAGVRPVLSFVEKPDPQTSRRLASDGALVNSFILASQARTLVRLFEDTVPDLARMMVPFVLAGSPRAGLHHLYDEIPTLDFSRSVLERAPGSLGVLAVPPCGWSDLGTPSRLQRFLGLRSRVDPVANSAAAG